MFADKPSNTLKTRKVLIAKLKNYLSALIPGFSGELFIEQFPGGYSNLTFLLKTSGGEYVLRKPPNGADIKSAQTIRDLYSIITEKLK